MSIMASVLFDSGTESELACSPDVGPPVEHSMASELPLIDDDAMLEESALLYPNAIPVSDCDHSLHLVASRLDNVHLNRWL